MAIYNTTDTRFDKVKKTFQRWRERCYEQGIIAIIRQPDYMAESKRNYKMGEDGKTPDNCLGCRHFRRGECKLWDDGKPKLGCVARALELAHEEQGIYAED